MGNVSGKDVGDKIDRYLSKHQAWSSQLTTFRKILNDCGLEETVKWGAPTYTLDGKIVVSFAGFKNHCALWFHNGAFLKDTDKVLINAQKGTTRGLRQWRFEEGEKVPVARVKRYVKEAMANQRAGKVIMPQKKSLLIPEELNNALKADPKLRISFSQLTPGRQREYADFIGQAKQEKTRRSRLEKCAPQIRAGEGLYDQYKKG